MVVRQLPPSSSHHIANGQGDFLPQEVRCNDIFTASSLSQREMFLVRDAVLVCSGDTGGETTFVMRVVATGVGTGCREAKSPLNFEIWYFPNKGLVEKCLFQSFSSW